MKKFQVFLILIQDWGLILHLVQIYPSICSGIKFRCALEIFFSIKPIFDLLAFSVSKNLINSLAESLKEGFVTLIETRLDRESIDFIKEKVFNYAKSEGIAQKNRKKFYELLDEIEKIKISDTCNSERLPKSLHTKVDIKTVNDEAKNQKNIQEKIIKKQEAIVEEEPKNVKKQSMTQIGETVKLAKKKRLAALKIKLAKVQKEKENLKNKSKEKKIAQEPKKVQKDSKSLI